jgi:hypothetical protein
MNGTIALTSAGVRSRESSTPHEVDDAMRRFSSSIRSGVRATSMPPVSVYTPSSRYCRALSIVKAAISLEWSVRKMKFEAWPVDPPGFGSVPFSTRRMSRQPRLARCQAMLLPTMPAPMMTTRACVGTELISRLRPALACAPTLWRGPGPAVGPLGDRGRSW